MLKAYFILGAIFVAIIIICTCLGHIADKEATEKFINTVIESGPIGLIIVIATYTVFWPWGLTLIVKEFFNRREK